MLFRPGRWASGRSDFEFPDTLDTAGISKLVIKFATSRGKDFSEETVQQLMKDSIKIGRGFQFAMELPESADAHYAGRGVKRDAKDRPIFWYRPKGGKTYRVLYADLTLRDSLDAPRVVGGMARRRARRTDRRGIEKFYST
jgi:hypothetical protein